MEILPLASPDSLFYQLLTYADLLLGLVFLILVSLLLPGRVRWLVLTFGLGMLVLQFWQRRSSRDAFDRLDRERSALQARLSELDGEVESLRNENRRLEARRQELDQEQENIAQEAEQLGEEDNNLAEARETLSRRRQALQQENMENSAQQQRVVAALERWQSWRDSKERLTNRSEAEELTPVSAPAGLSTQP